jgi:hypothetical protein
MTVDEERNGKRIDLPGKCQLLPAFVVDAQERNDISFAIDDLPDDLRPALREHIADLETGALTHLVHDVDCEPGGPSCFTVTEIDRGRIRGNDSDNMV